MSTMQGNLFGSVNISVSTAFGARPDKLRRASFGAAAGVSPWATGISLSVHPRSRLVPAVHLNTRLVATTRTWFRGGSDLAVAVPDPIDVSDFQTTLKRACDAHNAGYHARFEQWSVAHFKLNHRGEGRGVGGIFYDWLDSGDWKDDFAFIREVGLAFLEAYPRLVRRHMDKGAISDKSWDQTRHGYPEWGQTNTGDWAHSKGRAASVDAIRAQAALVIVGGR
jgi:coproporphyrinogen III oxidase